MADPVTWMVIATAVSAGGQVMAGQSAKKAAAKTAEAQEFQGRLAQQEASAQAAKTEKDAARFRDRQMLAYMKSGVSLSGSPLLVLDETIALGNEEADAIRKRGYASQSLYNTEASVSRSTGKAQFISGITGAAGTIGSTYYQLNK